MVTMEDMQKQRNKKAAHVDSPDERRARPKRKTMQINVKLTPEQYDVLNQMAERLMTTKTDVLLTGLGTLRTMTDAQLVQAKVKWMQERE